MTGAQQGDGEREASSVRRVHLVLPCDRRSKAVYPPGRIMYPGTPLSQAHGEVSHRVDARMQQKDKRSAAHAMRVAPRVRSRRCTFLCHYSRNRLLPQHVRRKAFGAVPQVTEVDLSPNGNLIAWCNTPPRRRGGDRDLRRRARRNIDARFRSSPASTFARSPGRMTRRVLVHGEHAGDEQPLEGGGSLRDLPHLRGGRRRRKESHAAHERWRARVCHRRRCCSTRRPRQAENRR